MFLIKFWTSIPHRRCIYLELWPTRESWYMKQSTASKSNFLTSKCYAKDMKKFQQAFQEVRRFEGKMSYEQVFRA